MNEKKMENDLDYKRMWNQITKECGMLFTSGMMSNLSAYSIWVKMQCLEIDEQVKLIEKTIET